MVWWLRGGSLIRTNQWLSSRSNFTFCHVSRLIATLFILCSAMVNHCYQHRWMGVYLHDDDPSIWLPYSFRAIAYPNKNSENAHPDNEHVREASAQSKCVERIKFEWCGNSQLHFIDYSMVFKTSIKRILNNKIHVGIPSERAVKINFQIFPSFDNKKKTVKYL